MLQDNGSWLEALHRDNVILLNEEVNCLHEGGIVSKDQLLEFDIIIFATGFKAQEFFIPIKINGGDGDFHSIYDDSPESYLGITFSNLPNFFAMYGPGTNLAHAGSIIFHSECQIGYICQAIDHLIKNNYSQIKVKQQVVKEYQSRLEERLSKTVWQHPKVNSWYQNSQGKVVTTSPWRLLEYWNWTNNFNPEDYDF
jgi:4-hydroxyacetophenone monooxygenase